VEEIMDHEAFAQLLGNYGEFVGAIAVVVTLAYLAVQVRHSKEATEANTKVAKATTRQALADGMQRLGSDVVENDDIARILTDGMAGIELKPHEIFRLQVRCFRDLRFYDNAFYQFKEGLLTDEEWEPMRMNLALVMQFPAYKGYWDNFQVMFSRGFRDELNSILASEPPVNVAGGFGIAPHA
jgi:hypothetical protein